MRTTLPSVSWILIRCPTVGISHFGMMIFPPCFTTAAAVASMSTSGGDAFDDADFSGGRDDSRQPEAGFGKQIPILLFGPFLSAGNNQHRDVEQLAKEGLVARRNHAFDDQ